MNAATRRMLELVHSESGVSATEYAIMLALIVLVTVGVLASLGGNMSALFTAISNVTGQTV